jgi:hypothetical protein
MSKRFVMFKDNNNSIVAVKEIRSIKLGQIDDKFTILVNLLTDSCPSITEVYTSKYVAEVRINELYNELTND